MIRRPPGSTRTDTLFPYTTLFRSRQGLHVEADTPWPSALGIDRDRRVHAADLGTERCNSFVNDIRRAGSEHEMHGGLGDGIDAGMQMEAMGVEWRGRKEERRVGKESGRKWWSRLSPYHYKKKQQREITQHHKT